MENLEYERAAKRAIRDEITKRIGNAGSDADDAMVTLAVHNAVADLAPSLGINDPVAMASMEKAVCDDFLRLGPLEDLRADESISDIMVNGGGVDEATGRKLPPVTFVEVGGVNYPCPSCQWDDDDHLMRIINRIGSIVGRECTEASPLMDARLLDGSRVNAAHPSVAIDGPSLSIRRFRTSIMSAEKLVEMESCTPAMMQFLESCVKSRLNIIVSGGTGSGKTTLLNVLATFIPMRERVVTIEDSCELIIEHPDKVRLESRPNNSEGKGAVTIHDLVVNALRMKPDRIVVGECRSDETVEMLQAMQTGHDGSLTTVHANNPVGVFSRIVTMCVTAQPALGPQVIERQIGEAVDLIVHTERMADGRRIISSITAVEGYSDGAIVHTELFGIRRHGFDSQGHALVEHCSCGMRPRAIEERIVRSGNYFDPEWFMEE